MVCGTYHTQMWCSAVVMVSCNVCILYLLMPKGVQSIININYVKRKLLWAKQNYIFCIIFYSTHFFSWYLGLMIGLSWIKKSTSHERLEMDGKKNKIWENDKAKKQVKKNETERNIKLKWIVCLKIIYSIVENI